MNKIDTRHFISLLCIFSSFVSIAQTDGQVLTRTNGGSSWEDSDGNGIYSGSGISPSNVDVTVTDNVDFDGGTLFIDGTNNEIGIGTDNPLSRLEVRSSTIASNGSTLLISNAAGGVVAGDVVGGVTFNVNDASSFGTGSTASIEVEADFDYVGGGRPSSLVFYTSTINGALGLSRRMAIDNAGAVSINTSNATAYLNVGTSSTTGTYTTGGWQHSSDRRLKDDIIGIEDPLSIVHKLNGVYYYWKNDRNAGRQLGFIAQDVRKVLPEVVSGTEGDIEKGETLSMAYQNIVPVLVEALKELEKQNKVLEQRITELEAGKE